MSERLIFRKSKNKIKFEINNISNHTISTIDNKNNLDNYIGLPGDKMKFEIKSTDENGNSLRTSSIVIVRDLSISKSIEKRKRPPRILPMIYLEQEVDILDDANFYFEENNKMNEESMDLLLGIQGWRRFIFETVDNKKIENEKIKRILGRKNLSKNSYQFPKIEKSKQEIEQENIEKEEEEEEDDQLNNDKLNELLKFCIISNGNEIKCYYPIEIDIKDMIIDKVIPRIVTSVIVVGGIHPKRGTKFYGSFHQLQKPKSPLRPNRSDSKLI